MGCGQVLLCELLHSICDKLSREVEKVLCAESNKNLGLVYCLSLFFSVQPSILKPRAVPDA